MAMVPRTVPVPVTASIHTVRSSTAVRPTASEPKAVEELSPQVEAQFETDQYLSAEYGQLEQNPQQQNPNGGQAHPGPFNKVTTPSKLFADIFVGDLEVGSAGANKATQPEVKGFTNLVSKAINTYETNAKVISGQIEERGSALSFRI